MDCREAVELACLLEVMARKPGNVHADRDFGHIGYLDFVRCAVAVGPPLAAAAQVGVGPAILNAVAACQAITSANANLGIVLLLAPLAAVPASDLTAAGIEVVLQKLTVADARAAYAAIRLARPRGLGDAPQHDVATEPTITWREAMILAAPRDLVARQYTNGFAEVRHTGLPALHAALATGCPVEEAVLWAFAVLLAIHGETDIARKVGTAVAAQAQQLARDVMETCWPEPTTSASALPAEGPLPGFVTTTPAWERLEAFLVAAGNQRNPGTTADLVTASLFWGLRTGQLDLGKHRFRRGQLVC